MSKRLVGVLVLAITLLAFASGCTLLSTKPTGTQPGATKAGGTQPTATVAAVGSSIVANRTGTFVSYTTQGGVLSGQNTGMALVTLFDSGTAVGAKCPINGLMKGDKLSIEQLPDAVWIVTGKL
jgi:hypothetical protein